jgi:Sporulation and spore germination
MGRNDSAEYHSAGREAMIPRYQTVLFSVLLLASIGMGVKLWQLRERAHQRLLAGQDSAPTRAPEVAPMEQATILLANDTTDSLEPRLLSLPLPPSAGGRARAVLGRLLDLYAAPGAAHPVAGGAKSILNVFLLPANSGRASRPAGAGATGSGGPELAVVNLSSAFAGTHPSGIETETLTILSLCATLHTNLPRVSQVRFLVDGQQRQTLAGHADLTRTYLTSDLPDGEGAQR